MVQHLCPNSRYNSVYGAYIVATSVPIDPNVKEFLRAEPFHLPKVIRYANMYMLYTYIYMYINDIHVYMLFKEKAYIYIFFISALLYVEEQSFKKPF